MIAEFDIALRKIVQLRYRYGDIGHAWPIGIFGTRWLGEKISSAKAESDFVASI